MSITCVVGNLPPAVSRDDVAKLINKLCSVKEVYVPGPTPTGTMEKINILF